MELYFVFQKPKTRFGKLLAVGNMFSAAHRRFTSKNKAGEEEKKEEEETFCHVHIVLRSLLEDSFKGQLVLFSAYKNTPFDMYLVEPEDLNADDYVWLQVNNNSFTEEAYNEATTFMRNQCGKPYNMAAYINCAVGKVVKEQFPSDSWFCSQITLEVAKRYFGMQECTLNPAKTHPTELFAFMTKNTSTVDRVNRVIKNKKIIAAQ